MINFYFGFTKIEFFLQFFFQKLSTLIPPYKSIKYAKIWLIFFWILHPLYKNYSETLKLTLFHVSWTEKPCFWLNFPLLYVQNGSRYDSGGTGAQFYDAFLLFTLFILQTKNYDMYKTFTQIKSLNSKNGFQWKLELSKVS